MKARLLIAMSVALLAVLLPACESEQEPRAQRFGHYAEPTVDGLPSRALPGGETSYVSRHPGTHLALDAFSQPSANLAPAARGLFAVGNAFFTQPWVQAPASTAARDGLGPLFNAAACQDCHLRDGRGHAPTSLDDPLTAAVVRIAGLDGRSHPVYGSQLQTRAVPALAPEARVVVDWRITESILPDGTRVELRAPAIAVSDWGYGKPSNVRLALRVPPPMIGVGLLEAIAERDLEDEARRQFARPDGPRGRLNRATDRRSGETRIARFGWKAGQTTVEQQVLHALFVDMGLTSDLFEQDVCTDSHTGCRELPSGGDPEVSAQIAEALVFYSRHLAPPARRDHDRDDVLAGEALFADIGCADCHRPSWTTARVPDSEALSDQQIWPYTDLLLHDMGPDLADGIVDGEAGGRDWRTAPLWGLGHTQTVSGAQAGFLHDGRARTLIEAILWHGGDAEAARLRWADLPARQRRQVIRFLASL
ncbi:di-heme oxidoredictase family protein [uncultured Abyssibacter sp.]|uniref:di-heme oxidoreductase family protein n=1 Tax=uncultured Abyssibacter sp. TaxID=2320202 RepID=UPI0032B2ABD1